VVAKTQTHAYTYTLFAQPFFPELYTFLVEYLIRKNYCSLLGGGNQAPLTMAGLDAGRQRSRGRAGCSLPLGASDVVTSLSGNLSSRPLLPHSNRTMSPAITSRSATFAAQRLTQNNAPKYDGDIRRWYRYYGRVADCRKIVKTNTDLNIDLWFAENRRKEYAKSIRRIWKVKTNNIDCGYDVQKQL